MKTDADWQDELYTIGVALYEQRTYVQELIADSDGSQFAERELQEAREERYRLELLLRERKRRYRSWLTLRAKRGA